MDNQQQDRIKIIGTGSYLPERVVTNAELSEKLPATSDEWIVSHTGISSRHVAAPEESPASMGVIAAQRALEMAGVDPKDLGFVLGSTATPEYNPVPATACVIQGELGATNAGAFDLSTACCGFVYNLEVAKGLLHNIHHQRPILIVATEMMSRMIDWTDHKTCILFGDAAAAAVVIPSDSESGVVDTIIRTDGANASVLRLDGGCQTENSRNIDPRKAFYMEGSKVFTFAIKAIPTVLNGLAERNHLNLDEVDYLIPHQANYRIIHSAGTRMGLSDDRFFINVDHVANTASASIPIALDELNRSGRLKRGQKILTASFGAGLSYGGNYIIW